MKNLTGRIIETSSPSTGEPQFNVGERLRKLRDLTGMSQLELANKMQVSRSVISRMERSNDVNVKALEAFISGLGAKLKIDASFDAKSPVTFRVLEAFELEHTDDNQLVFPIIDDDRFKAKRDVVLSIKPQYSEPIINGSKTVELRRRFPVNVPSGALAYIYSTSPTRALTGIAEIEGVSKLSLDEIWTKYSDVACIYKEDFDKYFSGLDAGFAINLKNARPLKRAIGLAELRDRFQFEAPQSFIYVKPLLREALKYESSTISH